MYIYNTVACLGRCRLLNLPCYIGSPHGAQGFPPPETGQRPELVLHDVHPMEGETFQ